MTENKEIIAYPLDMKVLAVCVINHNVGDWAAYIGAVPGELHEKEKHIVARKGTKLPEYLARAIFDGTIQSVNIDREANKIKHLYWRI